MHQLFVIRQPLPVTTLRPDAPPERERRFPLPSCTDVPTYVAEFCALNHLTHTAKEKPHGHS